MLLAAQISIICGGVLSVFMALFHTQFYRMFRWRKDFERITGVNKNIFYTLNQALIVLFFGFAVLSFACTKDLASATGLAFWLDLLLALFWAWRTVWQVVYFRPKDKTVKNSPLHYVLTGYFFLLFASYVIPLILSIPVMK